MTETAERISLADAAHLAWGSKAGLERDAALSSFRTQLMRKLKTRRDDYDVDVEMFPDEYEPHLQLGAIIDGLTFCLTRDRALAVVNWRCEDKSCNVLHRAPVSDLVTLGRALARGEASQSRYPKCDAHRRRLA